MTTNISEQQKLFSKLSASTYFLIPILLLIGFLILLQPASEIQYQNADPLIRLLPYPWISLITILLGAISIVFWIKIFPPDKSEIILAGKWSLLGALMTTSAVALIYFINGPEIPSFIPPEESSASGLLLGLSAGVLEEIVFRMMILPLLIYIFARKLEFRVAIVLSVLITGLLFSLSHELAGDPFQLRFFITRFIVPGLVMSVIFIKFHPSVIIIGHSVSHIAIATLLTST